MEQTFVQVMVDEEEFFCKDQKCNVRIFMSNHGVCPCCNTVGVRLGDCEYPDIWRV